MSRILVIAGTDSSGGAGLSRDVAMATTLGCAVAPVVTAVTVQTNAAVIAIQPIDPDLVAAQIRAAFDSKDTAPKAVKIGMLGTPEIAQAVARSLPLSLPVVLDPVLKSTSGGQLMPVAALAPLLRHVTLLTPNLAESALLSDSAETQDRQQLQVQARRLLALGPKAVLIKGGHGDGPCATDHLFHATGHQALSCPRLARGKRGTGCSLATAVACRLALGDELTTACHTAKNALFRWLKT